MAVLNALPGVKIRLLGWTQIKGGSHCSSLIRDANTEQQKSYPHEA
jgi:hypothetical protein